MGVIRPPRPVNLICGLISNDPDLMLRAVRLVTKHVGPTDEVSDTWPFDATNYYEAEMGQDLLRRFVSFEKLVSPGALASIKTMTNQIEERISYDLGLANNQRPVNLDPGYVSLSKLVLATTKDFSHRVYIGEGIYAESTIRYQDGQWIPWPWTYPDYADGRYHAFFTAVRTRYRNKLNAMGENRSEGGTLSV